MLSGEARLAADGADGDGAGESDWWTPSSAVEGHVDGDAVTARAEQPAEGEDVALQES